MSMIIMGWPLPDPAGLAQRLPPILDALPDFP